MSKPHQDTHRFSEHHTSSAPTSNNMQPESQRSRFRYHLQTIRTSRGGAQTWKGAVKDLKIFFTDCWLDIVTLLVIVATAAGVWVAPHTHDRLFPITFFTDGAVVYPQFAYPYVESIFSPGAAGCVAGLVPLACVLGAQIWLKSVFDLGNGVLGLAYSLSSGVLFQVTLKKTIGGLRPHFLSVCEPVIPEGLVGIGFQNLMFTAEQVCTGDPDKVKNGLESFPSGHSQIAWSGLGYLSIYLFTHLRVQSYRRRPSHWKMLAVLGPLLLATYMSSSLVLGYHHHGYDVIFGAIIGIVTSFLGYRMVFMSILNSKWNHIPSRRWERREGDKRDEETVVDGDRSDGDRAMRSRLDSDSTQVIA